MEGWHGWDEYAAFYDWENAQTMGRQDVTFWQGLARREGGPVLELGCGTGRVTMPVARTGVPIVGVDRSDSMLAYAARRARRLRVADRPGLVRGDIRSLPFPRRAFTVVMAPYGILQSLTREADLGATLQEAARVLPRGGTLGIDLVPDLPAWDEYQNKVRFRGTLPHKGRAGSPLAPPALPALPALSEAGGRVEGSRGQRPSRRERGRRPSRREPSRRAHGRRAHSRGKPARGVSRWGRTSLLRPRTGQAGCAVASPSREAQRRAALSCTNQCTRSL